MRGLIKPQPFTALLLLNTSHVASSLLTTPSVLARDYAGRAAFSARLSSSSHQRHYHYFGAVTARTVASVINLSDHSKLGRGYSRSVVRGRRAFGLGMMSGGESTEAFSSSAASNTNKGLFLFDFDGVVCDSCDECTVSAWRTCHALNVIEHEENESSSTDSPPQWLFDKMREIRPAIEVGWQIPVLLSVFLEQRRLEQTSIGTDNSTPAMTIPEIINSYETLVESWLERHNLQDKDMIQTFGQVRDDWIANDYQSWLDINTFYNGISDGITACHGETILVTTKQHRFATSLCRHAGISDESLPDDHIYGLGMYKSKADVIVDRISKGNHDAKNTHFFEDRWPTIAKCLKDDRLEHVKFYLCSWGYCTEEEIYMAEKSTRVEVLTLGDFSKVVC